eukprot:TRINITY_DN21133_c0_g1_i2.p1 TRINITY_DN21133_c0_g1~~TRINITY_DN21133_c0_g1_i2.p1  ORF type:complete len:122 (-),score=19.36 TRINITY_DN21133_c0_g1_i2:10-375(-)
MRQVKISERICCYVVFIVMCWFMPFYKKKRSEGKSTIVLAGDEEVNEASEDFGKNMLLRGVYRDVLVYALLQEKKYLRMYRSDSLDAIPKTPVPRGFYSLEEIGRAVQQECRDRSRMPSSA